MPLPEFFADFNRMIHSDNYVYYPPILFSAEDWREDKNGQQILLTENMPIIVFMNDVNDKNEPDRLIAKGIAVANKTGNFPHTKWFCEFISELVHENEDNFWLEK